jgi:hypothetical protein
MIKKKIQLELSKKMYNELSEVSNYIGISIEEYLLMLILRTQPVPAVVPQEVYNRIITGPTPVFKQPNMTQEEMNELDARAKVAMVEGEKFLKENYIG